MTGASGRAWPAAQSPPDAWVHDPDWPVPFITPPSYLQVGGPDDYSGVETRGDVLVYTSDAGLEPGHRIRLEVASSAHPKFDPNLGTGGDESVAGDRALADNRLYHDAARPSRLLLTVLR